MLGEVVGWVQRRHERKRTLGRIPLGFVVDVVKDQPVQSERTKTSDCDVGDLLCSFTIRRETRRGQSKEQELASAGINAADQIHGRDGIEVAGVPATEGNMSLGVPYGLMLLSGVLGSRYPCKGAAGPDERRPLLSPASDSEFDTGGAIAMRDER